MALWKHPMTVHSGTAPGAAGGGRRGKKGERGQRDDGLASPVWFNFHPSTVYERKDEQSPSQSEIVLTGKRGIFEKRNSSY